MLAFWCTYASAASQTHKDISITGYFQGRPTALDSFPVGRLNYLIFCFCHLEGNKMHISNAADTASILKMDSLKKIYPGLKIILSLGGWGGCQTCSRVFSSDSGRMEFAASAKVLLQDFDADGIDLDWEYPAIEGFPGHPYSPDDKKNFTELIRALRHTLGKKYEISFAAGGFDYFISESVEWLEVMKITDRVNIMSYDLVHGASRISGHHTPLYSTTQQSQSADNAVNRLIAAGVPPRKIIIGSAFYARMFQVSDTTNHGLYDSCFFYRGISYSHLYDSISRDSGFIQYLDTQARAPYAFNAERKILVTYDDTVSVTEKVHYVFKRNLGGIMFWQMMDDKFSDGLLESIYSAKNARRRKK